jgi:alpha-L-rhamnosidase
MSWEGHITMFVESAVRPITVNTRQPRFSWQVPLTGRGRRQGAYRVRVATDPAKLQAGDADLWDSGRVESPQSVHIPYAGKPLPSNIDCFWTVQLWDENNQEVVGASVEQFGTPLFDESDWHAKWIGMGDSDEPFPDPEVYQHECVPPEVEAFEPDPRSPMMRRAFALDQPIRRARAYVCGVGLHELHLNGEKVGDEVLTTPRTAFRQRVLYTTYDVTSLLRGGENAVGLMLGNGWFNGQKRFWGWQQQWHGSPRAIVQLEIELADGTTQRITSDDAWRGAWSPITFNCLYDGETYDARLEQPGWSAPGFDDADWSPVNLVPAPGGRLEPMACDPELATEQLRPVAMVEPEPGTAVYDFGRNITGWVRLRIQHAEPGTTIKLRFGEAIHDDGRLNNASNNAARQTDHYICRGGEEEIWEPRFTFHGFQFVEVTGAPGPLDLQTVEGRFVRTAVPQVGRFACGSEPINNIHRCTVQSLLCNVQMGVPTDDTQRPERLGWGCDAWACANAAFYNMGMQRLYQKWIGDFRDQQDDHGFVGMITPQPGPDEDLPWSAAFVLIPWWQYVYCGDRRILEENYDALQRYMEFLQRCGQKTVESLPTDVLLDKLYQKAGPEKRFPPESARGHLQISQWGDHLSLSEGYAVRANLPLSIATAFYYLDVSTMARIAEVLGKNEDAGRYRELAEQINAAFHDRFFDPVRKRYDGGYQNAQAWPLAFGMVADEYRGGVESQLTSSINHRLRHLTTGYASTRFAIRALAAAGRNDVVWDLATATTYPSWNYMLRLNRTTSCENWMGEGGSLNHAPLGSAIDEWFYSDLAGIQPDEKAPGYETIIFKPYMPADLPWAQASLRTMRGTIQSGWRRDGDQVAMDITVPANSRGIVHVPCGDSAKIMEQDGPAEQSEGVVLTSADEAETIFGIGSGSYSFTFPTV